MLARSCEQNKKLTSEVVRVSLGCFLCRPISEQGGEMNPALATTLSESNFLFLFECNSKSTYIFIDPIF